MSQPTINAFAVSGVLIAITSLTMAVFVYCSNRRNRITRLWAVYCLAVALWGIGVVCIAMTTDPRRALWLWRVVHVPIIVIPVLFYHFVTLFIGLRRPRALMLAYTVCAGFLMADATPWFIAHVRWVFNQFYYDSPPGILYPYFVLFFIGMVIVSHVELWRFMTRVEDERRLRQVRWFFLGSIIGFMGAVLCFPPVFGIDIYPYSNFAIPLYPVRGYTI